MSRTSCLASFSGSSAFAMKSVMSGRKRVPTRSSGAIVKLLSKRVGDGGVGSSLPAASEDAVENNEQRDGQKSAAGEAMPPVATPVSVVPVGAEVRTMEAIRVPERPEGKAKDQRDCDEDEYCWDDDEGEHCCFLDLTAVKSSPAHRRRHLR